MTEGDPNGEPNATYTDLKNPGLARGRGFCFWGKDKKDKKDSRDTKDRIRGFCPLSPLSPLSPFRLGCHSETEQVEAQGHPHLPELFELLLLALPRSAVGGGQGIADRPPAQRLHGA